MSKSRFFHLMIALATLGSALAFAELIGPK
jgi:hypothetical protein